MPSSLEIHIIDVGQGESSLILLKNGGGAIQKSVLIDGGLQACGPLVSGYLVAQGVGILNVIVCSHYEKDDWGGVKPSN